MSLVRISNDSDEIVVKEFRLTPGVEAAVEEERAALARLETLVDSQEIRGWTVRVPKVVAVSWQPPGLALTRVPGSSIDDLIQRGWVPPAEVSAVFAEVFQRYWRSCGHPLGDVNLKNLLCDPESRQLAIVDPGTPGGIPEQTEGRFQFAPASLDLGCLLHEVLSTNVLLGFVGRAKVRTRLGFTRSVIETCMLDFDNPLAFVEETAQCAAAFLRRVSGGSAIRSRWRMAVRRRAHHALIKEVELLRRRTPCD